MRHKTQKLDYLRANFGKAPLDALFIHKYASHFKMRDEQRAADEIRELMAADRAVAAPLEEFSRESLIAQGEEILAEMRATGAYAPTVGMLAWLSKMKGHEQAQKIDLQVSAGPNPEIVRARIAKLMADQAVREKAKMIDVDLDALESGQPVIDVAPRRGASLEEQKRYLGRPSPEPALDHESEQPEQDDKIDPHAENLLASHLKTARELD